MEIHHRYNLPEARYSPLTKFCYPLETAERIAAEGHEGVHVHLYGKTESRPKRKMGHITFVGMTAGEYERRWAARFV